jgi:hypothetical protein
MKNIKIIMMMIIVGAAFLSGCAATKQARSVEVSGFLNEYKSELKPGKKMEGVDEALLVYMKPNLKEVMKNYPKLMLAPVTVWDDPKHPLNAEQRNDYLMLADSFHAELYQQLSKYFEMVDKFQPGALRAQFAIIHGEKHTVGLSFISKVVPQARALNAVWTFATGKPAFTGSVDAEFKVTDADTGELLWAGADRRVGGQKLFDKNVFKSWGDVQNIFTYWSELAAYRMCDFRGDKNCEKPKTGAAF